MSIVRQYFLRFAQSRHFILTCVVAAALLRIGWIAFVHPPQVSDFAWYYGRAASIANGQGYSFDGLPTAYWPVGYPAFLGAIFYLLGTAPLVGQLANVGLSVATIVLSYRVSKRMFHSEIAARLTVLLLTFHLNQIAFNSLLCSEIWFTFLLMLGAAVFLSARGRYSLLALSGICWGLGTLTKPQLIFLPLIFLLVSFTTKIDFLKSASVVYAMLALCLIPWAARNQQVMGEALLSTNGGIVLMQGNNPYATGTHIWNDDLAALIGEDSEFGRQDHYGGAAEVTRAERARKIATAYIAEHPVRAVALWPRKLMYAYRSDVDGFYYSLGQMEPMSRGVKYFYVGLRVLAEFYYLAMLALALAALTLIRKASPREHKLGLYVILYFSAICVVFIAIARYHFPIIPFIAIYSGVGAALLLGVHLEVPALATASPVGENLPLPYPATLQNSRASAIAASSPSAK